MAGINLDTANTGYGGNYGGGAYGYGGSNIMDLAALGLVFGDGFGRRGHYEYGGKSCCAPATCEQVNDVDRDVIKCSNDVDRDVLQSSYNTQRDIWNADRDVLLTGRDIKEDICDSTHKLEKDIWDTDKDLLLGFKCTDHKIDMLGNKMSEGFAEVKGLIKETALCQENKELARRNAELHDKLTKQDTVHEILAAIRDKH